MSSNYIVDRCEGIFPNDFHELLAKYAELEIKSNLLEVYMDGMSSFVVPMEMGYLNIERN